MRAVVTEGYGEPPVLREVPDPEPGEGEVLVRVAASSVNNVDLAIVGGYMKDWLEHRFPVVLGADFAGTVERVGPDITDFAAGDRIFGTVTKGYLHDGGFAELAPVIAASAARLPEGLPLADAGTLGVAGTSALNSVNAISPVPGQTVLIAGATGSVGAYAIQIAAERGLKVIATATPGTATEFVAGLGAVIVVDHTEDLTAQVRDRYPDGVDAAIHLAGDRLAVADLIAPGGHLAFVVSADPTEITGRELTVTPVMGYSTRDGLKTLAGLMTAGKLRAPITRMYPLAGAPQAIADYRGHLGKLAISVPG